MRAEYIARINRVVDYIEQHLDADLQLAVLAKVAYFSPYHFHRIFHTLTGETLNRFIRRLRVERAATRLNANPKKPITEIALDCGFSSPQTFSRAFKDFFDISASEWREQVADQSKIRKQEGNIREILRKQGEAYRISICQTGDVFNPNPVWRIEMMRKTKNTLKAQVTVKDMPEMNVAYVRHVGPYAGMGEVFQNIFQKLGAWAGPRGMFQPDTKFLCVYHDDPGITEEDKLRVDACMTVPNGTAVEGEVGAMTVAGGRFAVAHFELNEDEFGDAWDAVMGGWLPGSGYEPDDRLCYELCLNKPDDHPEKKHIVDICVPVRPM